jgi:hypothetical protein
MKQTAKQAAYYFFLRNAGFGYDPKTETKQQGRSKNARNLATAERDARAYGFTFVWDSDWHVGSHKQEYGYGYDREPSSCESCVCYAPNGDNLGSLGCIDDATDSYRRVIEAELAMEALADYTPEEEEEAEEDTDSLEDHGITLGSYES